jgi:drug/metabolite transporter (DMT)-like permease
MPYLVKKLGGLALILLGGLIIVHGVAAQQTWEIWPGLVLAIIGAALLAAKILRRNTFPTGGEE